MPLTLLIIGALIEILFLSFVWVTGQMSFGWPFVFTFIVGSISAVSLALFIAHVFTIGLWKRDYDPGESSVCKCTHTQVNTDLT